MGIFDNFGNLSQGDQAALAFFGNMATPASRIPVPLGFSVAQAGAGIPKSMQEYQTLQKSQMENLMNQLNLGYTQQMMPYRMGAIKEKYGDATGTSNTPTSAPMGVPNMNNPGNMRPVGASTGFQSFATPQDGVDAMTKDLNLKISGLSPAMAGKKPTLNNIISTWAPPNENNTGNYVKFVSDETGIAPDQVLTPQQIPQVQKAMIKFEGNSAHNSSSALNPQETGLSSNIQNQIKQLKLDSVLSPEKASENDAKIADLYKADPKVIQATHEAEKTGENSAEVGKTLNVMTANLPRLLQRLNEMREASKDASYGLGIDEEGTGYKQEFHNQFDAMLGRPEAAANATLQQYAAQGILPELGPQLAQAGIRGNKFLETIASNASGLNLSAPPDAKLKLINGLEQQFVENLKATAKQARAYGDKSAPTDSQIEEIVTKLKGAPAIGAPKIASTVTHIYKPGKGIVPVGEGQ